ncbi:transcriptional regulator GlxA family with amidase domain [Kibdelosporangium banguiense]|uniref:Transcriptional regulator GlxA family with amidase domain n=1 Tax=Kibdelosporangium banguiense TaxID=1365924 RepID=A0ABS4U2H5_9PSEU|nr:helix-turn-helix domain-containing protein [Kibdelosporangium banguiense]MBP2330859.1 transcriptional regulator GlxA family with amidase domain [Kibdelosporangium banguiense]
MDVAMPVIDDMPMYELGIAYEVFGTQWLDPWYSLKLCGSGPTRIESGFTLTPADGLDCLATAEMVLIPAVPHAWLRTRAIPPDLIAAVRAAASAGARMVSLCSGAFVLAAAGILDGMRATTHWQQASTLARWHPLVEVDPTVLYVDNGDVLTSAGRSAGLDLCLHIVRRDFGAHVANQVARRMVVPAHRPGGQSQYVDNSVPAEDSDSMGAVLQWACAHLAEPLTVEILAHQAKMSTRTFVRRFREATGTTPRQWLLSQRLNHAKGLLESTNLPIGLVSEHSGLGSAANFRQHFGAAIGTTPTDYRRAFHQGRFATSSAAGNRVPV